MAESAIQEEFSGPGDIVKEKYDAALKKTGGKIWNGILAVGASGFGKGVLIAAALLVAAMTVSFGFGAYAGELAIGGAAATVEKGLSLGLSKGIGMLTSGSGYGIAALLAGGTVGAVADIRKQQAKLSAAEAERMGKELETMRQQGLQPQRAPEAFKSEALPKDGWCACEQKRRAQQTQMQKGLAT